MTYLSKEDFHSKLEEDYNNLDMETDMIPIIDECYDMAEKNKGHNIPYTNVVIKIIEGIKNRGSRKCTFNQWKCISKYQKVNNKFKKIKL